jgi:hypothetical protein
VLPLILALLAAIGVFFRSRAELALKILALRQQVAVFKCQRPRLLLTRWDRLFWTTLRHLWPPWSTVLAIVKTETVVGWQTDWLSFVLALAIPAPRRSTGGEAELRSLIRRRPDRGINHSLLAMISRERPRRPLRVTIRSQLHARGAPLEAESGGRGYCGA